MIGGFFFLGSIIAIFIVLDWFSKNDGVPEDQRTSGLLAMRMADDEPIRKKKTRWTHPAAKP